MEKEALRLTGSGEVRETLAVGFGPGGPLETLQHISGRQMFLSLNIFRETDGFI